ncbi:MAG: DUF87 domain-containing protein [Bacillota bacterium]
MDASQSSINIGQDLVLPLDNLLGKCIAILGIRGSGKTNTSAVLIEELLAGGMPIVVVDIEGEYWGLKERFEVIVVGKSARADIMIGSEHGAPLARESLRLGIPLILDVSGFMMDDINALLLDFFTCLWQESGAKRTPYHIVLEEAHEFVPQNVKTDLKEILGRIALRGRKRGLGVTLVSQRSAKVEKDILTQAELLLLHKVVHPSDLRVYKDLIPWPHKQVEENVLQLKQGEAIFLFRDYCQRVTVRKRYTFHAGFTPDLKEAKLPELKKTSDELIKAITRVTQLGGAKKDRLATLKKEVEKLKLQLAERDKQIEQLESQLQLLSRLKVNMDERILAKIFENVIKGRSQSQSSLITEQKHISTIINKEKNESRLDGSFFERFSEPVKLHGIRIMKRILTLNEVQKAVLKLLVSRHPSAYTYSQIASWVEYSESTLYKNNPSNLIQMGLIGRKRKGDGYHFWSTLHEFITEEFSIYIPEITEDHLDEIFDFLRNWICTL